MTELPDPPDGWTIWNAEPDGRIILAYRPDVFNSTDHPPECLPTLYISQGRRNDRRPGNSVPRDTTGDWHVRLYFEPDVELPDTPKHEDRDTAIQSAYDLAADFAAGDVDPRDTYQIPREDYFVALDEHTGNSE